ncbi:coiled-coil domain-containing protein [Cytobacillus purgationiresistens]|uniref:Peptidoglycan hydrolase CwlO-like protein n=1 Tax=Cytobacillus purgationiresistens TaxID=863449 RepID=A0ABU0AMS4_9BACI|nr:C40 family peptidase [Cytobacillus purgationiresistens]MDQ0272325.1 peptidoglycan hydrolase CwlO-like protein [Cytobacillus purgationiresistens]
MKKKIVALNTTIMLGLGAFALPSVSAESIDNIKKERSDIQSNLSKAEKELATVLAELGKLEDQIKKVDQAMIDNDKIIAETENSIKDTKEKIKKLEAEIAVIQERIDKRAVVLKERALAFQESGGTNVGYIDVLLGATSFSDFIDRVGAITKIVEADQDLLLQHDADKKEVEEKKSTVDTELAGLNTKMTDLEGMRAQMQDQKKQNDKLKQELKDKETVAADKKSKLQTKDSDLAAMQAEIERSMAAQTAVATVATSSNASSAPTSVKSTGGSSSSKQSTAAPVVSKGSGGMSSVISAGNRFIGNSVYVFGGGRTAADVAAGRFDCSGFVHWAFAQGGYSVGASTDALKNQGTPVPASQMQPGDLVFFDTYKKDGHVGIYIGGGRFIGSQSNSGVAIANMSSGYWADTFNGRVNRIR